MSARLLFACAASMLSGAAVATASGARGASSSISAATANKNAPLSLDAYQPLQLISSRYETHNTRRFLFANGGSREHFDMPVASCVVVKYVGQDGKEVMRPFTPISSSSDAGHIELLVKKYPNGKMGNYLFSLKPGDEVLMKGPYQKIAYKVNMWERVGMLAGGTGITPMYQLLRRILENPKDQTRVSLIFANRKREDILLANELVSLQSAYSNFHLYCTLTEIPKRWIGGIGYISRDMIRSFMPAPREKNTKILVSGPPAMMQALCGSAESTNASQASLSGLLHDMGYPAEQVYRF